ncbi:DUF58 domain-containing protein [Rossellomorea sp. YZS02]|uniref:DUF58 domain-containing protein n=1 Tax=Rossellomorea sp. YZS02 TaxID=3097358 RepID=UPI002A11A638|nr:DUF58 domain-containing protein [Rossellomorea sp. YZS02]MDX8342920.1 DUF58 domain-containing protein [Rossellomorea sp. YZS02]
MRSFWNSQLLAQLKRHRIRGNRMRMGLQKGSRIANYQGSSLEFSDYQMYELGDDVRQIDWNVYARTNKIFIKRYLDEREIKVHIYLDCTNSMVKEGRKWKRARELAGAISFLALANDDHLTLNCVGTPSQKTFTKKGPRDAKAILFDIQGLSSNITEGESLSFFKEMEKGVRKKNPVSFIISDGLEPISLIRDTLKRLSVKNEMIYFIQLLDEEEMSPTYLGDVKLIDSENHKEVNVSLNRNIVMNYQERLRVHNDHIESLCKRWGFGYLLTNSMTPLNEVFLKHFKENGWIR